MPNKKDELHNTVIVQVTGKKDFSERVSEYIRAIEKEQDIGPIIGEAREMVKILAENCVIKDIAVYTLLKDPTPEKMSKFYQLVRETMEAEDVEK